MNAKDKESPWNEIFDNFSFLVFSLSLSPSLWISSHLVDWSRINIGGLFCHRRKNIGYCPRKVVDPHPDLLIDWSEERIYLATACLNYHRLVLISRSTLKEKPNQLGRKYLVLAGECRSSSADPDQRSQRTKSLYLSCRRRHERGPPWLGLQMSWQHRCLSNLSKNEKLQYFWILITLILGIHAWNLVESHQTQISFSSSKTEVMQFWN